VAQNTLSKSLHILVSIAGGVILITGFALLAGWLDPTLSRAIAQAAGRQESPNWPGYFRTGGGILLGTGILLLLGKQVAGSFERLLGWGKARMEATDRLLYQKSKGFLHLTGTDTLEWPLRFNRWDVVIVLFFVLIAFFYQLAVMSSGFPTVILGGDAANIAGFAAGRAFPSLFKGDAILGDLNNIGLYVTIHLPIVIWLEKLVGNFGLAYSLLLFPHVFLQFFSYYLLGRTLYQNRYWAFLFSLAVSAPLALDGGEVWGVVSDAMPRFTFQVLIPFILILLLSAWREKPGRWPWVMVIAGLMAFIHPVSTPAWAFALWLGFWPILPRAWNTRRRWLEMFKLGIILALALLPYASIYLTYHQGGSGNTNYDLVHFILTEYFPSNLLNIPAALQTLLRNTAQFGLLWYGLAGLALTFLLFRSARARLKQMLVWMAGIAFISILVPWVETNIERTFRIIPLQTELMRGMRYLVPFLFIFWFYPLAELTHRAARIGLTRAVFAVGTLLTLSWLLLNSPEPFTHAPYVFDCWGKGQFICPNQSDYADVLTHVREDTPEGAKFVVFLTSRWSGIEVRYLGLRPMVYAYKDRGQLAFTNLKALEQWYYYLQRENAIFSRNTSPTLDDKRTRIVDFARDSGADYILTDFPFPPDVQLKLEVTAIYQNSTYYILKSYPIRP
jgi:hypothetical protein